MLSEAELIHSCQLFKSYCVQGPSFAILVFNAMTFPQTAEVGVLIQSVVEGMLMYVVGGT